MAKAKKFDDPLAGVDPIMEEAFSVSADQKSDSGPSVSNIEFPELTSQSQSGATMAADIFSNIPVNVSVELGRSHVSLKEVYELSEGSIIELDRLVGEPLDLVVNGQTIAQGEVVAIDNNYGLRVTSINAKS